MTTFRHFLRGAVAASQKNAALRATILLFVVFATTSICAQPPQRGSREERGAQRSERSARGGRERGERSDRSERPGRGERPGRDQEGRAPERGQGDPRGGGFGLYPGDGGQPNPDGARNPENGDQPNTENAQKAPARAPEVNFEEALAAAIGTVPIRVNQNIFRSSDGVRHYGTYYKGGGDKDTPVVVILPGLDRTKDDENIQRLAIALANDGCAVLIPELRGRGEAAQNQQQGVPGRPNVGAGMRGGKTPNPRDVMAMINVDREFWFDFLTAVHDEGYCNVKKTILVGSEFSAALAAAWAKGDWQTKGAKGQNVVGLALLSPDAVDAKDKKRKKKDEEEEETLESEKYDVLASLEALHKLAKGRGTFGCLLIAGSLDKEKNESALLIQKKIGGKADEELKPEEKSVMFNSLPTEKQGETLMEYENYGVDLTIRQFVKIRLKELSQKRNKWTEIEKKNR